jgi:hypothetical protein|tara:strand:- start:58 stop:966 length:909 start_codon:yes stop_codon:yes gene_type:complete
MVFQMDITLVLNALPSIPPESLRDYVFIAIFIPNMIRLFSCIGPYLRFRKIMPEGQIIKALKLVGKLEIPGLDRFIIVQIALILLPTLISIPILFIFGLGDLTFADLDSHQIVKVSGIAILLAWFVFEARDSLRTNKYLNEALDGFEEMLNSAQRGIDSYTNLIPREAKEFVQVFDRWEKPERYIYILEQVVSIRKSLRSAKKAVKASSPQYAQENLFPWVGGVGKTITDGLRQVVDIPKKIVENTVEYASDSFSEMVNSQLEKWFMPTQTRLQEAAITVLWAVAPSLSMGILVWWNELGVA